MQDIQNFAWKLLVLQESIILSINPFTTCKTDIIFSTIHYNEGHTYIHTLQCRNWLKKNNILVILHVNKLSF